MKKKKVTQILTGIDSTARESMHIMLYQRGVPGLWAARYLDSYGEAKTPHKALTLLLEDAAIDIKQASQD